MSTPRVAYFCMEYGLHEDLPVYSGGLGILAGDTVKSAHDLGLPLVALGLLWSEGYTVQRILPDGTTQDEYPPTPRTALEPVSARCHVTVAGKDIEIQAYRVRGLGAGELYLMEPVDPEHRWITKRLYAGGAKDRVAQELILGVGGVRLLRALGIAVDRYHFNEGHAVFAGFELIREEMARGKSFHDGWTGVRPKIVFTTHTPVKAGNEVHPIELLQEMSADLGVLRTEDLEALGGRPFGMTVAGLRLARIANAVAELHGETSRAMWADVQGAAPILSVTNGVHVGTWQDERVRAARTPDALFSAHQAAKNELLAAVRESAGVEFKSDKLLVGFARRAATYKRADLIFRKPKEIAPLLEDGKVQLLFAGKAHPQDLEGKALIKSVVEAQKRWPSSVLYLENYNMRLGRLLTRGCDVWMNNPVRPLEASGTSGMKAAMNGVLNLSVLDGWWPEGCVHGENGWQVGDAYVGSDQDEHDRTSLLRTLKDDVMATYYGDPGKWVAMMQASIAMSRDQFSSDRMVRDYYQKLYVTQRRGTHAEMVAEKA